MRRKLEEKSEEVALPRTCIITVLFKRNHDDDVRPSHQRTGNKSRTAGGAARRRFRQILTKEMSWVCGGCEIGCPVELGKNGSRGFEVRCKCKEAFIA